MKERSKMAYNLRDAVNAAKQKGPNMNQSQGGGGEYEVPAAGFTRLRFVGYFELGKKETEWKGTKKVGDHADLVFELSGPKHAPRETENGKFPIRITVPMKLSLNEKANFFKLFRSMNWEGKADHIAELLGNDFVGEVEHAVVKGEGGKPDRTFANLKNIRKPFATNPETGDDYRIEVAAPLTELKLFLWDFATPEMWDSIFIEGEWDAKKNDKGEEIAPAKSKNVIQEKIKKALNFKALPIYDYAVGAVKKEDAQALDDAVGEAHEAASPRDPDVFDDEIPF